MKMTSDIPDHAKTIEAALTGFVRVVEIMIAAGVCPPFPHDVPGLRYQMEPPGEEDWKLPHYVMRDGWADCEDLAIWTVAGLHHTGIDPGAWVRVVELAPGALHAMVQRSDGSLDDPSIDLHPQNPDRVYAGEIYAS